VGGASHWEDINYLRAAATDRRKRANVDKTTQNPYGLFFLPMQFLLLKSSKTQGPGRF
jgi:hypothetical protein